MKSNFDDYKLQLLQFNRFTFRKSTIIKLADFILRNNDFLQFPIKFDKSKHRLSSMSINNEYQSSTKNFL